MSQALESEWIVTMGGAKPVDLGAAARVAGALARERKFKKLAQAVIALNRFGALSQVCCCCHWISKPIGIIVFAYVPPQHKLSGESS